MKSLAAIACLLLFLTTNAAAAAATSDLVYEVEVLVFETNLPELEGDEFWIQNPATSQLDELSDAVDVANASKSQSALSAFLDIIKEDKIYRVLAHKRWVQSVDAKSTTKLIRIRSDKSNNPELDGIVRFYRTRFLRLDLNLLFRTAASGTLYEQSDSTASTVYRIDNQRRMWKNKINYFDHPKFGALVQIKPVKKRR
jgi:hypothetical protein